jgi:DNA-binding response OmpR family regulator
MRRSIDPQEVLRRVKMLVERAQIAQPSQVIESGDIVIDPVRYTVARSGRTLQVSLLEFRLLYFLASHRLLQAV